MSTRTTTRMLALALALIGGLFVGIPTASAASTKQCTLQVIGQQSDGQLITGPLSCTTVAGVGVLSLPSGVIAIHYTGANLTGSSLSILGSSCTGGWLNLPGGWTNVISSTTTICSAVHYDLNNLGGSNETISGAGNLGPLDNKANSVQYL